MDKMNWCKNQTKGIELIESKEHLSKSYFGEAEETLRELKEVSGKWKLIMAYYSCYNALYSILMKIGVKCEIHDCTIELMNLLDFSEEEISFLKKLKFDRIEAQYYLKKIELKNPEKVKLFVNKCKEKLFDLNSEEINVIRNKIKKNK